MATKTKQTETAKAEEPVTTEQAETKKATKAKKRPAFNPIERKSRMYKHYKSFVTALLDYLDIGGVINQHAVGEIYDWYETLSENDPEHFADLITRLQVFIQRIKDGDESLNIEGMRRVISRRICNDEDEKVEEIRRRRNDRAVREAPALLDYLMCGGEIDVFHLESAREYHRDLLHTPENMPLVSRLEAFLQRVGYNDPTLNIKGKRFIQQTEINPEEIIGNIKMVAEVVEPIINDLLDRFAERQAKRMTRIMEEQPERRQRPHHVRRYL